MKLIDYISKLPGGQAELAKLIGAPASSVNHWIHCVRPVPVRRCLAIEKVTSGVVRRWDLRPDDWFSIWPELIGTDGAPQIHAPAETD